MPYIKDMTLLSDREEPLVRKDFLEICQHLKYEFKEAGNTIYK